MKSLINMYLDYQEYAEACESPCSFYIWLTDGVDNVYTDNDILQLIRES